MVTLKKTDKFGFISPYKKRVNTSRLLFFPELCNALGETDTGNVGQICADNPGMVSSARELAESRWKEIVEETRIQE